ncbi:Stk1 family PASTA domain-containing Ser/Thr kinase [Nocardiopsis sp. RSe5-2]|uniref:non-specific serine/threonine protein kinase n=1 Tax=Nocardiopsis endophytica TaxID=3018445 RepID=A0ABT4U4W7_9ACTN|nr:Stk1 family PASTA domain-containing Ser/Thr kinase [Nocardiopsis endophytica]MDA2811377.1 Stk1 family PASTA domain-containing Ser/Thr kinase [Nocardiopsis endophytica]
MSQPRLFGGRYELDALIGRGGMAEVHRARDLRLDRLVAVKTLRADLARDHTFQERFRREAQSAASLNHPSIIAVYDTGEDMVDGVPLPFIVMEYVDGRTLKEILDDGRKLLPERCAEITGGILRALEYSHRNGIVHRDIKPANVMLTKQAEVKVMDFGIARAMNDNQATMTQASQVIGTAQYLSPEQARGERVDARSDIYSTGCVLYELLTGGPPFTGDSPVSIAYQHVREDPVPPADVDPEIPEWLDAVVLRSMAKDRDERYQSAEEMRQDLERGLQGMQPAPSTMAMGAAGSTTALPPVDEDRGYDRYDDDYDRRDGKGGKAALWTVLVLALIAAAALVGFLLFMNNGNDGGGGGDTPDTISVPDVSGSSFDDAEQTLRDEGFTGDISQEAEPSEDFDEDQVTRTDPEAGEDVAADDAITVYVSSGPEAVQVPNLEGMAEDTARQTLQDNGLSVGQVSREESDQYEEGVVIRSSPGSGEDAAPGSAVDLVVSEGSGQVQVPDLSGRTQQEAAQLLSDEGLNSSFQQADSDEAEPGRVIAQDPAAGEEVAPGTLVTVTIAREPQSPPPDGDDGQNGGGQDGNDGGQDGGDGQGDEAGWDVPAWGRRE